MIPKSGRLISDEERFRGGRVILRLVNPRDCTARYVAWLQDPEVNRYLETRWTPQSIESVRAFVEAMRNSSANYLLAILDENEMHIGNIKIGPVNAHHLHADVSYFIGERDRWGKGLATDAIRGASRLAFDRLGLYRVQAGVYASNVGSIRALERVGFRREGSYREQLVAGDHREDHFVYGLLARELPAEGSLRV
jgi:[ribosomal protein S5]-alanine N-acetyltransferase